MLNGQVECWVQDFWNEMNNGSPVPQSQFYTQLDAYINNTQIGQDQYNDYLIGYINGELRFMRIKSLSPEDQSQGYDRMNSLYNDWENLIKSYNGGSPQGINKAYQSGGYPWAWLVTQRELVTGAIQGILISIFFSFIVILASTLNIISSVYSIICITCIILSVVGTIQMLGWSIGVTEAIAVVIIVGFSVDYVVHLANHYVESVYIDKFRRMKDALTGIGISIFSGAITTIASSIFLFLATIKFFESFAILVLATILFSLLFSLVLFSSINFWIGPSGNFGNAKHYIVTPLIKKLKECCKKKNVNEDNSKDEQHESEDYHV